LIAAPIYYAYLKDELREKGLIAQAGAAALERDEPAAAA
jgi:hypothetical protein